MEIMMNNTNYADIVITRYKLPLDRHYCTYKWEGKITYPVILDPRWTEIDKLPFPLKCIEENYSHKNVYIRKDAGFGLWWRWVTLKYWLKQKINPIYYRLMITAMVWGLAYVDQGAIPSWRDLGKKPRYK
ncbi:MAG: hypothetical protein A2W22_03205 [Candidatus Levybacteria bacterium RBG_16_35_11]|nr:MAG: hypothetical protein A2W22_03205 [Candidatus Levybacteria bacterium RBG_16_35_11]